jgi:hypothetical protein
MNLHLKLSHYDKVACSGREHRENIQYGIGYGVCFRTRGGVLEQEVVLCSSHVM